MLPGYLIYKMMGEIYMTSEKLSEYIRLYNNELFNKCIPFWLEKAADSTHGGVYCSLDRDGNIYSTDKSVWLTGRCAWTFAHLCNVYQPKPEWLMLAKSCLDFLNKHCIDTDGRMFFLVTEDGRPLRKRRYYFSECFYIIANAEYYAATGNTDALQKAREYFDLVMRIYHEPSSDPYFVTPKGISSTRDTADFASPMIILNVANIMRRCDRENTEKYDAAASELLQTLLGTFWNKEYNVFMEHVLKDTNRPAENCSLLRLVNPGHTIEACWFILDEAVYEGNAALVSTVEKIFTNTFRMGWDEKYGGLFYFRDVLGYPPEAIESNMKLWWPHCEALIAAAKLYAQTGKEEYSDIFETVTDYAFKHFSSTCGGEWYGYLCRNGELLEPSCIGNPFKGAFHVPRMLIEVTKTFERIQEKEK